MFEDFYPVLNWKFHENWNSVCNASSCIHKTSCHAWYTLGAQPISGELLKEWRHINSTDNLLAISFQVSWTLLNNSFFCAKFLFLPLWYPELCLTAFHFFLWLLLDGMLKSFSSQVQNTTPFYFLRLFNFFRQVLVFPTLCSLVTPRIPYIPVSEFFSFLLLRRK